MRKALQELVKGIPVEYGCQEKEGGFSPIVKVNGEITLVADVLFATQDEAIADAKAQLIIAAKEAVVLFNRR